MTPSGHGRYWRAGSCFLFPLGSYLEGLVQHNGFSTIRPGGDHVDRHIAHFGNTLEVAARIHRQLAVLGDAGGYLGPARQFFEYRLGIGDGVGAIWQHIEELATITLAHPDLDGLQAVEYVELGDAQTVNTVDHDGSLHGGAIKPAATTRAPGNGTE